jgi:hypothetical protein
MISTDKLCAAMANLVYLSNDWPLKHRTGMRRSIQVSLLHNVLAARQLVS